MSEISVAPASGLARRSARIELVATHWLILVLSLLVLRVVLAGFFLRGQAFSAGEVAKGFLIGLHLDAFVALLACLPLMFWLAVAPDRWFKARWHRRLFFAAYFLFWFVQTYLVFTEFYFFDEFKSRFNTVAVDYLMYHHEVFVNIWEDYPVVRILAACAVYAGLICLVARKVYQRVAASPTTGRARFAALAGLVVVTTIYGLSVRLKEARFSGERLLNEIANNGQVSFVTAFLTSHLDYAAFYRTLPPDEAIPRARRLLLESGQQFVFSTNSLQRRVEGDPARPRLNVVLFLEESLGSEFWPSLSDMHRTENLMPEMEKLAAAEGLLFTNLYASGNRTVRGFEGVFSSFPPLPGDSIVKRDLSENVETIARVLQRDGYSTLFLYGGRGFFDSMRKFALNNGYERFIEEKDFPKPTFKTSWGVCDEDLMQRTLEECRALAAAGKPFLATALTVSNHRPFTYPEGRIPEDPKQKRRVNAVKYADYALGRFFAAARQEPFWTNTVFVVVADHGARVYGSQAIPIHSYEIPLLIVGPAVVKAPQKIGELGGSLDVAPTILGLIGRPYDTLFFGRDLLKPGGRAGWALINHNRDIGLYRDDRMVVLGLNKTVEYYHGNPRSEQFARVARPDERDLELERDAIALYQAADDLYIHERYRVRPCPPFDTHAMLRR